MEVGVPSAVYEMVVSDCVRTRDGAERARPRQTRVENMLLRTTRQD